MKIAKNSMALLLTVVLSLSICACGSENNEIKTLTKSFENACNKVDINGMLDCVDPTISKSVKTVTGFIGMFSDKDTDELLDSFAKMLFKNLPENSKEFFTSIKISVDDIEIEGDKATASAEITYDISGETNKSNATFKYTYTDNKWYISNLDIE